MCFHSHFFPTLTNKHHTTMYQSIPTPIPTEDDIQAREERYRSISKRISWGICFVYLAFLAWVLYDSHTSLERWRAELKEATRELKSIREENNHALQDVSNTLPPTFE